MYNTLTRPRIAQVRRALTAIGADFPKPVQKALAEQDKILAAARRYEVASTDQIQAAVADCFLNGRDPADDDQVRRLVTSRALASATGTVHIAAAAEQRVVDALAEHADTILDTLAPHVEQAGMQLAEAHDLIGDHTNPTLIMGMGVPAVEAWSRVQHAQALLGVIDRAWTALASLTGFASSTDAALRLADLDLETFEKAGRNANAWEIVRAGGRLSLATPTTYRERAQRVSDEKQERQGQADSVSRRAWGRQHSFGVKA